MPARYRTREPSGYLPAGMRVDVITLSLTPELLPCERDYAHFGGESFGDGQWIRVRYPNGIQLGMVRIPEELPSLGIELDNLEEIPSA